MPDPPLDKQCWFRLCRRVASTYVKVNGVTRKVCKAHGQEYGSSMEQGFKY